VTRRRKIYPSRVYINIYLYTLLHITTSQLGAHQRPAVVHVHRADTTVTHVS
jgi:hypothetical protein